MTLLAQKHFNEFKKIKIIPCTFSYHKGMKLKTNNVNRAGKPSKIWTLNNIFINGT